MMDVNDDGHWDIATGWEECGVIRSCIKPGPEKVADRSPGVTVREVKSPEDAVFVDLDADGDLDVITCEERANLGVFWYENPTQSPK
jgi:hypothetical protein